jgi:hypothetical protein
MTTGSCCSTPGCPSLTSEPGGQCRGCQIATMPRTVMLVKQIVHAVLGGPEIRWDHAEAAWREDKEAES